MLVTEHSNVTCMDYALSPVDLLKSHHIYALHTREKPFKCELCGFMSSYRGNMKVHMRTHTGKKPFNCGVDYSLHVLRC